MATVEAPLKKVAKFPPFMAPETVPSRMSNLAEGLWSGLNDLRDGLGEAFFLRLFGCFLICGSYMPGMWSFRLVFFDEQSYCLSFFKSQERVV